VVDDCRVGDIWVTPIIGEARSRSVSHRHVRVADSRRARLVELSPREDEAEVPTVESAVDHLEHVDADLRLAVPRGARESASGS
jgi:hypothetical protein